MTRTIKSLLLALGILASLGGVTGARAGEVPLDEAGFTAYVSRALAREMPRERVTIAGPLSLAVAGASGGAARHADLHALFSYCRQNSDRCDDAVKQQVARVATMLKEVSVPVRRSMLRAAVASKDYIEALQKNHGNPVAAPVSGGLWLICVVNFPQAAQVLNASTLASLRMTREQAIEVARKNVAAALQPLDPQLHDLQAGGIGLLSGDPYISSWLLFPKAWAPMAERLGGHLIVAVPATDAVLYSDERAPHAVDAIAAAAAEMAKHARRSVSSAVFRWTAAGWERASE